MKFLFLLLIVLSFWMWTERFISVFDKTTFVDFDLRLALEIVDVFLEDPIPILFLFTLIVFGYVFAKSKSGNSNSPNKNAFSINQSGGITTNELTLNTEPTQRHISDEDKLFLSGNIPADKPVSILQSLNDAEADAFAIEIREYLRENGFNYKGRVALTTIGGSGRIFLNDTDNDIEIWVQSKTKSGKQMESIGGLAVGLE